MENLFKKIDKRIIVLDVCTRSPIHLFLLLAILLPFALTGEGCRTSPTDDEHLPKYSDFTTIYLADVATHTLRQFSTGKKYFGYIGFMPDGRHLLYTEAETDDSQESLYISDLDRMHVRLVGKGYYSSSWSTFPNRPAEQHLVVTPDGRFIVAARYDQHAQIIRIDAVTGETVPILRVEGYLSIDDIVAASDSKTILISVFNDQTNASSLYRARIDDTTRTLLKVFPGARIHYPQFTPDQKHIVYFEGPPQFDASIFTVRRFDVTTPSLDDSLDVASGVIRNFPRMSDNGVLAYPSRSLSSGIVLLNFAHILQRTFVPADLHNWYISNDGEDLLGYNNFTTWIGHINVSTQKVDTIAVLPPKTYWDIYQVQYSSDKKTVAFIALYSGSK